MDDESRICDECLLKRERAGPEKPSSYSSISCEFGNRGQAKWKSEARGEKPLRIPCIDCGKKFDAWTACVPAVKE